MVDKIKRKDDFHKDCCNKSSCGCEKTKLATHKPLRIFCGQGGSAQFATLNATPAPIGFVTVDAKELCRALVKIKFSSIISLASSAQDPEARLIFNLFKVYDNEQPIQLESWVYESFQIESQSSIVGLDTSFSFIYCDTLNTSRICDYFVEVSIDNIARAGVSVDNVQIQAIAQ